GVEVVFLGGGGGWSGLCGVVSGIGMGSGSVECRRKRGWGRSTFAVARSISDAFVLRKAGYRGRLMVAVLPGHLAGRDPVEGERTALRNGLEPVAAWPVTFLDEEGLSVNRMLRSASLGTVRTALRKDRPPVGIPGIDEFFKTFEGCPRSLENNADLLSTAGLGGLPSGPMPPSFGRNDRAMLGQKVEALLGSRYGSSYVARARAEKELRQLRKAGLCGYLLLFGSIVEHCRRRGIAYVARGSAAGSIVAHLLGLSAVCPLRYGLSFERFYNYLRSEPPDIDLDVDSRHRDEVVEWFLKKTERRSALVSEMVRLRRRSALRMAAKAYGAGSEEIEEMSRMLGHGQDGFWKRADAAQALRASRHLVGLPSHLAPHPCGLVCCPGSAADVVPLEPDEGGRPLSQLDKDGVKRLGLMKMDILGQRGLSVLTIASGRRNRSPMALIREHHRISTSVLRLLDSGCTLGVANVESPAMRGLLRRTRVRSMEDVARALALVRPGASAGGGRETYLRRIAGREAVTYLLPALREVLRENLGVMIYQEDVSAVAGALLGTGPAESDLLRRKLKKGRLAKEEIVSRARVRGFDPRESEKVWRLLSGYAGYGFCRAHAFSYAAVSCASATLKAADPALFMASVLAGGGGFYPTQVYLEEARRMGVSIAPPGINTGGWLSRELDGAVVLGFRHLRGLGRKAFEKLANGRPYSHPAWLVAAGCSRVIVERMAVAGCFEETGMTPGQALWSARGGWGSLARTGTEGLPPFGGYTPLEKVQAELETFGLALTSSLMEIAPRPNRTVPLAELPPGGRARVWGRPVVTRRLENGASFLMLEDDTGIVDAFLPSRQTKRLRAISGRPQVTLVMEGELDGHGRLVVLFLGAGPPIPFESDHGSRMRKTRACGPGQHGGCR
ncbi:hypothetical protein GF402_11360, partial [Candidatus Fermentibacteria bacterium]|nr:hypothetical protein [Candidatus Fermentibacteria bacterium]